MTITFEDEHYLHYRDFLGTNITVDFKLDKRTGARTFSLVSLASALGFASVWDMLGSDVFQQAMIDGWGSLAQSPVARFYTNNPN